MSRYLKFSDQLFAMIASIFTHPAEVSDSRYRASLPTKPEHRQSLLLLLCSSLLVTSCAMGPDYSRPQVDVAQNYRLTPTEGRSIANLPWWELLKDKKLQLLIDQALQENKDLKQTTASVEELQARLRISNMDFIPDVNIEGNAPALGTMGGFSRPGFPTPYNYFGQTILNWELDIWGRLRRANEAPGGSAGTGRESSCCCSDIGKLSCTVLFRSLTVRYAAGYSPPCTIFMG